MVLLGEEAEDLFLGDESGGALGASAVIRGQPVVIRGQSEGHQWAVNGDQRAASWAASWAISGRHLGREPLAGRFEIVLRHVEPLGLALENGRLEVEQWRERGARRVSAREHLHEQIEELHVRVLKGARADAIGMGRKWDG